MDIFTHTSFHLPKRCTAKLRFRDERSEVPRACSIGVVVALCSEPNARHFAALVAETEFRGTPPPPQRGNRIR